MAFRPLFPINNKAVYNIYIMMKEASWSDTVMIDAIKSDIMEVKGLSPEHLKMLMIPVSYFSIVESMVLGSIIRTHADHFTEPEHQLCFGIQAHIEGIHQLCYGELLRCYFDNVIDIMDIDIINKKTEWVRRYMGRTPYDLLTNEEQRLLKVKVRNPSKKIAYEVFMNCILEGVDIPSNFGIIFWFRTMGMLKGLTALNEYIEVDEHLHHELYALLYQTLKVKLSQRKAHKITKEWFELTLLSFKPLKNLVIAGFSYNNFELFLKHLGNNNLIKLGYEPLYDESKNLDYMLIRDVTIRSARQFDAESTSYIEPVYEQEDLNLDFTNIKRMYNKA